jgi:hypothetical protein
MPAMPAMDQAFSTCRPIYRPGRESEPQVVGDAGPYHVDPKGLGDVDGHDRHRGGVGGLQQDERSCDQHDTETVDK